MSTENDVLADVSRIQEEALRDIREAKDRPALQAARNAHLAKKAPLNQVLRSLKDLPPESRSQVGNAANLARKALELVDSLGMPHRLLADIYRARRQWDKALAEAEQAVSKDANAMTMFGVAINLDKVGRHEESVAWFEKILRLDPYPPVYFLVDSGVAYFMAERYEDALAQFKRVLERAKEGEYNLKSAHRNLAATYSMLGQEKEARHHAAELLRLDPKFSLERLSKTVPYKNKADIEHLINALRKAGLK